MTPEEIKRLENAFNDYDCRMEGHVWIDTKTGLLYTRDKTQSGSTSVFCRHCGDPLDLVAYGKATAQTPVAERVNEYDEIPSFVKVETQALEQALLTSARLMDVGDQAQ